jgi:glucose/arabinose dehydrogenase
MSASASIRRRIAPVIGAYVARAVSSAAIRLVGAGLASVILGVFAIGVALASAGAAGMPDVTAEVPGAAHRIRVEDLPPPHATPSVDNGANVVPRPPDAWPRVPAGFRVRLYADGLEGPRALATAPNGDIFVADSMAGAVRVLRGLRADGRAASVATFASGLNKPFGIAFYPPGAAPTSIYIAETDAVWRFPYAAGDLRASAFGAHIADLPGGGLLRGGGHWTRDLAFSNDGKKLYVSVGSRSNNDDSSAEENRADILEMSPEGGGTRVYASGIRNAVGIAVSPRTGELWASVNERDTLGDDLVPDYITHVVDGGFYGWPWFYLGAHADPRHAGKRHDLAERVLVPDVLLPAHSASLQMLFYEGMQFPAAYRGDIFAAEHGSWNRSKRTGYEVVRLRVDPSGSALGGYEDFMTGFVTAKGEVWGRPVGLTVAGDGALVVSDDGGRCLWRVEAVPR